MRTINTTKLQTTITKSLMFACLITLFGCSSSSTTTVEPLTDDNGIDASFADGFDPIYELTTEFRGEDFVLSFVELADGTLSAQLVARANTADEGWVIERDIGSTFNFLNAALGDAIALDVVNDGVFETVILTQRESVSGQIWTITQLDNGFCRLTNEFTGSEIALDVSSDGSMTDLMLAAAGDFSGQNWIIARVGGADLPAEPEFQNCSGVPL